MRLGIGSYTYGWAIGVPRNPPRKPLSALDLLDRAAALGVHVVQIADNLPLERLSPTELDDVERRAGELGVAIEVGTRGIAPDHLGRCLELATRFRSPILRVVIDTASHRPPEDEIVRTLCAQMPAFERAGVTLAIENHDRFTARTLASILARIDTDCVGICLDMVNSFGALEGPEAVVDVLGPWTVNLHIKDFAIDRVSHQMGFQIEGRPAGQGRLDIPWLLQRMRALGRSRERTPMSAILELWTPPEDTLEQTIAKEARWAQESIAALRQWIPD